MYFFSPVNLWQAANRFGYHITEMNGFMYGASGNRKNSVGNLGAGMSMNITRNFALADEFAVELRPIA